MLEIKVKQDSIFFGDGFGLNFQRTLRILDDSKTYPLPPGLGPFPICQVKDHRKRVPKDWLEQGGVFIPMYQREALWIRFIARYWKPNAVKVAIGKINAVSAKPWEQKLLPGEEDYITCPPQPWLDGINAGEGYIRQFVAMPLGMGYTVEAQVSGEEKYGGIQIIAYEPKPGKFPDRPPLGEVREASYPSLGLKAMMAPPSPAASSAEMGLAAGGKMKQKIYPDPHGLDTWDQDNYGRVFIHIVNSLMYREITGKEAPPTPVTAKTYSQYNLPWYDLYDEKLGDIHAPQAFEQIKTVKDIDKDKAFTPQQDDDSIEVPEENVIKYNMDSNDSIKDGKW